MTTLPDPEKPRSGDSGAITAACGEDRPSGKLVWAGNLTVNGEEMTGVAVEISPENLAGKPLPMYQDVAIVPAKDWKKLADAALWLREQRDNLAEALREMRYGHTDKAERMALAALSYLPNVSDHRCSPGEGE